MAKSVLVVDDSGSFRTVVNLILKQPGYEVTEAKDGQEAVEKNPGRKVQSRHL